MEKEKNIGAN